jgi:TonB family protein
MRILLIVSAFFIFLSFDISAQIENEYMTIIAVEQMPIFNNNSSYDFLIWLYQNIKYPDSAIKDSISGKVYARFKIDSLGIVSEVEIVRSARWDLDAEVRRVILLSPKWIPGRQNGKNVGIYYTIPIEFNIKDQLFLKKIKEFSKLSNKSKKWTTKHIR